MTTVTMHYRAVHDACENYLKNATTKRKTKSSYTFLDGIKHVKNLKEFSLFSSSQTLGITVNLSLEDYNLLKDHFK